jgi:hypothetical protein
MLTQFPQAQEQHSMELLLYHHHNHHHHLMKVLDCVARSTHRDPTKIVPSSDEDLHAQIPTVDRWGLINHL